MNSILLKATGLQKSYNVPVLKDFDFTLQRGEVHALVGSNGAGKSTFANILCGLTPHSGGNLELKGNSYHPDSRRGALDQGVVMVMQELNILPTLTISENLFFDSLPSRLGWINRSSLKENARAALETVGLESFDPNRIAGELGVGHQQLIEIAAALTKKCELLILDEPTAALTNPEIKNLFSRIRNLQQQGVGVLYISHRMEEIREISNRVTVLRDGRRISTYSSEDLDLSKVVADMAGKILDTPEARDRKRSTGECALQVSQLKSPDVLKDVSFHVNKGEILGLAGLVGSGRTECLKAIFGVDPPTSGSIRIAGREVQVDSPEEAVKLGIGMIPEDRKEDGLLLSLPVRTNTSLPSHDQFNYLGWMDVDAETKAVQEQSMAVELQSQGTEQSVGELSGGNQQKVMMMRWLLKDRDILLLDEPTRGIDVAAKDTFYRLLHSLAASNKAIIVVSSELPELLRVCDRIAVMSNGRITNTFMAGDFDEEKITEAAFAGYLNES